MKHPLDRPVLRDLFWFVVLPHNLGLWLKQRKKP